MNVSETIYQHNTWVTPVRHRFACPLTTNSIQLDMDQNVHAYFSKTKFNQIW